mmetsp:Transcript_16895/g.49433  ORF Transcript_16895/g.49433 Transcript_16895/m.49433 type:complete len:101 (-) Transcript_16895:1412-1714(-)
MSGWCDDIALRGSCGSGVRYENSTGALAGDFFSTGAVASVAEQVAPRSRNIFAPRNASEPKWSFSEHCLTSAIGGVRPTAAPLRAGVRPVSFSHPSGNST